MPENKKQIVLGVSGSIAAYKAGDIIRRLQDEKFSVNVVMTKEAELFISPLTLAALSGHTVFKADFSKDEDAWQMQHIQLAKSANLVLIAPATANVIAKLAHGFADDLLTSLVLATRAPILIAPAMNDVMLENPVVQLNCGRLKELGFSFIESNFGYLACGTMGEGRLADVDTIVGKVVDMLHS